jgi:hypothetical protein
MLELWACLLDDPTPLAVGEDQLPHPLQLAAVGEDGRGSGGGGDEEPSSDWLVYPSGHFL